MSKFKKKLIISGCLILILVGGISYKLINNSNKLETSKQEKKEMLAMYLEDESGAFQISNSKTFPKEGYVLDHAECKNGGTVIQDPETKMISASFSHADSCNLYFAIEKLPLLGTLLAKANDVSVTDYSSGNKGEMYAFDHDVSSTNSSNNTYTASQISSWSESERRDYRYIGANPNNWVKFNGEDWRIIGVFTTEVKTGEDTSGNPIYENQQLIKIIRNESIGNIAWDSNNVNDWPSSSLKTLLNTGDYYNRANTYANSGLNETARNQIAEVKWYLGGSSEYKNLGGPNYYSFERGTTVYSGHSTNTFAKVGLMYPSDYVYTYAKGVDSTCYTDGFNCDTGQKTNGWLFNSSNQWTISPRAGYSGNACNVTSAGYVNNRDGVLYAYGVRPSVYLKSNIKIISGAGSQGNPYTLA